MRSALRAALLCLALAAPAAAQEASLVSGTVTDRGTGQPLARAQVEIAGTRARALTDSLGRFTFRGLRPGRHRAVVSRVGYQAVTQLWELAGSSLAVRVALDPAPVRLDGIEARVNRFERRLETRRRAAGFPVRVFDAARIEQTISPHAWDFVRYHSGVFLVPCPNGRLECTYKRGRLVHVDVVIDEVFSMFGLDELYRVQRDDIAVLEVYDGTVIRVYTKAFVRRAAERGWWPS
ncbi:MAG TPA: carboxypeptidase regulatory-like domain-containing protein [Longimicrobiaceae bacterium]|nr:carboxypeptidase regulatory-like domain-containing protein [Longimicrobiaceae bacterium]